MTGQFGKNHLGDRNDICPTVHGFDEFFGNLYHLNAEEEPENPDYPKDPEFKKKFGPRGVIHCFATNQDDPTVDPRFGKVGKQKIEDTGPLTMKRMETVDEEVTKAPRLHRPRAEGRQAVLPLVELDPHAHLDPPEEGVARARPAWASIPTAWSSTTGTSARCSTKLDELGIADNTIVMYSTDNGAESLTWPDGGTHAVPRREEHQLGRRLPRALHDPLAGRRSSRARCSTTSARTRTCCRPCWRRPASRHQGEADEGPQASGRDYKVHLDGYNLMPAAAGRGDSAPRHEFFYWTDDGSVAALRYDRWKIVFMEQRAHGFDVWQEPFVTLRLPKLFNLRTDPFERADKEGIGYAQWRADRTFLLAPAGAYVAQWLQSFREFPPRQKPGSFNLDRVMEAVTSGSKQ